MTTYSTQAGLPLPENTDALIEESTVGSFASALDTLLVPQYSTIAARDAAMVSGKTTGQVCAVAGELQIWDGQQWWYAADTRFVLKGVDTTRASTTTVTADPQLQFAVKAGGTYLVHAWLAPTCAATTVNFRFRWGSSGSGVTFSRDSAIGFPPGSTTTTNSNVNLTSGFANTEQIVGTPASTQGLVVSSAVFIATADDTVQLFWAQGTSSASGVTLTARSFLEYRRIG